MQLALAGAFMASILAVAVPALAPHHVSPVERGHAAALLAESQPDTAPDSATAD